MTAATSQDVPGRVDMAARVVRRWTKLDLEGIRQLSAPVQEELSKSRLTELQSLNLLTESETTQLRELLAGPTVMAGRAAQVPITLASVLAASWQAGISEAQDGAGRLPGFLAIENAAILGGLIGGTHGAVMGAAIACRILLEPRLIGVTYANDVAGDVGEAITFLLEVVEIILVILDSAVAGAAADELLKHTIP